MRREYKTEITFTVTMEHLPNVAPNRCIQTIKDLLMKFPAFKDIRVISGKTNYRLNAPASSELKKFDIDNPFTLDSWKD